MNTQVICVNLDNGCFGIGNTYKEAFEELNAVFDDSTKVEDCIFYENCTRVHVVEERKIVKKTVTELNKKVK